MPTISEALAFWFRDNVVPNDVEGGVSWFETQVSWSSAKVDIAVERMNERLEKQAASD